MKIIGKLLKACICFIGAFILAFGLINAIEENTGINNSSSVVDIINENVRDVMYKYDLKEENDKKETKTTEKKKSEKVADSFKNIKFKKSSLVNKFSESLKKLDIGKGKSVKLHASDKSQLCYQIYRSLLFRKENITITYSGHDIEYISRNIKKITDDILKKYDNIKTSNDFDYLDNDIKSMKFNTTWNVLGGKISMTVDYLDDADEQSYVDGRVKGILKSLKLKNKSDYQKIKIIHDWIIENVKYDNSKQFYSAYAGLRHGKTVCQGYAMLTYKMLTEAGINCRIISGKANNGEITEAHAWNIVQLDGKWYNLDTTWDDGTSSYKYFLIGDNQMKRDHFSAARFNKTDFRKHYKMSKNNY